MVTEQIQSLIKSSVQPFGNLKTATILIIGHDPRLRRSHAEAEKPFFFEYLIKYTSPPTYGPDASKYALAHGVWDYVCEIAGHSITLNQLYVTNLCNEFLPSTKGNGVVLIPDTLAFHGVGAIKQLISDGNFRIILPMSVQVFYHLCRLGFVDEREDIVLTFTRKASPNPRKSDRGIYMPSGKAPFLEVCGKLYHHKGIPLIPILHVKQWPLRERTVRYKEPMKMAKDNIKMILS